MKLIILGGLMACQFTSPLPTAMGQDNQPAEQKLHFAAPGPMGGVTMEADHIERGPSYPSVIRLQGNVEIKTKIVSRPGRSPGTAPSAGESVMIMVVRADEADYHEDSGEIEARGQVRVDYRDDPSQTQAVGNVRIKLESARYSADRKSK
jgi:lipopolysaccharide assembly outer membrane protein LptD (OstA)